MKCYSTDDENFRYTSIDALFDAMRSDDQLVAGQAYYESEFRNADPKDCLDVNSLLESIDDSLSDEIGEAYSDNVGFVSIEARDELTALITGWMEKYVDFGRYWIPVGKSIQHAVTEEDVQEGEDPKPGQATLDTNWGMRSGPMHACPTCGNKRCPHAADLQNPCTNSNEPGQPGSNYPKVQT